MSASVTTPASEPTKEKRSKWRLSNPFHKDGSNGQQSLAPDARDSAYGGSETTTSDPSPNPSTTAVPTISEGQAQAQGAPVETKTDSRGRVVTTTTTTVTTTTTTTEGDSLQVPAGEEVIVRRDEQTSPVPPNDVGHASQNEPSIPVRNAMRNKSPHGGHLAPQNQHPVEVPASPSSPSHQNFSYPGRQSFQQNGRRSSLDQQHPAYRGQPAAARPRPPVEPSYGQPPLNDNAESPTYQRPPIPPSLQPGNTSGFQPNTSAQMSAQGYPPRQSTAQSIRTAAAGIHGAGEALRGALNSSIARNTGASPDEVAKHDAIAERGRQEIESGHFVKAPPPIPEVPATVDLTPEKKSRGLKNVLRKKSPARNVT